MGSSNIPWGSIATAGTGLIGNILGNSWGYSNQKKLLERQYQYEQQLQDSQNEFNVQMWEKNNEYNSPAEQVARLQGAGLNVGAAFGQGAAQSSPVQSSSPSSPIPTMPVGNYNLGDTLLDSMRVSSLQNLQKKQGRLLDEETTQFIIDNKYRDQLGALTIKKINLEMDATNATIADLQSKITYRDADLFLKEFDAWLKSRNQDNQDKLTDSQIVRNDVLNSVDQQNAKSARIQANASATNANANMLNAQTNADVAAATIENVKADTENKKDAHQYNTETMAYRIADAIVNNANGWLKLSFDVDTYDDKKELVHGRVRMQNGEIERIEIDNKYLKDTEGVRKYQLYCGAVHETVNTVKDGFKAWEEGVKALSPK